MFLCALGVFEEAGVVEDEDVACRWGGNDRFPDLIGMSMILPPW